MAPEETNIWKVENRYVLLLEPEQPSPTARAPLQALGLPLRHMQVGPGSEPVSGGGATLWGWGQALRGPTKPHTEKAVLRLSHS